MDCLSLFSAFKNPHSFIYANLTIKKLPYILNVPNAFEYGTTTGITDIRMFQKQKK